MTFIIAIPYNGGVVVLSDKRDSEDKSDHLLKKHHRIQGTSIYLFGSGHTNPLKTLWSDIDKANIHSNEDVVRFIKESFESKAGDNKYQKTIQDYPYSQEIFIFSREEDILKFNKIHNADPHTLTFEDTPLYIGSGKDFMNIQMQKIKFDVDKLTLEKAMSYGISLIDFISEFKDSKVGCSKVMGCDAVIFKKDGEPEEKEIELENNYSTNFFELYKKFKEEEIIY